MLVLSRKKSETIHIGDDVVLTIVEIRGNVVRVGLDAPKEIVILRGELVANDRSASATSDVTSLSSSPVVEVVTPTCEFVGT